MNQIIDQRPPRRPALARWFFITGVLALSIGLLFQQAAAQGVALFRMFGTIGVVAAGFTGTKIVYALQVIDGRHDLRNWLTSMPVEFLVVGRPLSLKKDVKKPFKIDYLLITAKEIFCIYIDDNGNRMKPNNAYRRMQKYQQHSQRFAEHLIKSHSLDPFRINNGDARAKGEDEQVYRLRTMVVFTRKNVDDLRSREVPEDVNDVIMLNPDGLEAFDDFSAAENQKQIEKARDDWSQWLTLTPA